MSQAPAQICTGRRPDSSGWILLPSLLLPSLLLASLLLATCQSAPTRNATSLERLQGRWVGHGPGGACSVTIAGSSLRFHAREDFWYDTTFFLPTDTAPNQLHATITADSSPEQIHIGTVVVALFEIEEGQLTLGVVDDFDGPPTEPVTGDWERVMDIYELERAQPRENKPNQPERKLPEDGQGAI